MAAKTKAAKKAGARGELARAWKARLERARKEMAALKRQLRAAGRSADVPSRYLDLKIRDVARLDEKLKHAKQLCFNLPHIKPRGR